jgi:predicted extracellular nuclease
MMIQHVNRMRQAHCHAWVTKPGPLCAVLALLAWSCGITTGRAPASQDEGTSTAIPVIQARGHFSPLTSRLVNVTGIVTAVARNGFYLQEPIGDGDDATSDAVFVATSRPPSLSVGDEVRITGTVMEFIPGGPRSGNLPVTQISQPTPPVVLRRGQPLPSPVRLGTGGRIPPSIHLVPPGAAPVNLQIKSQAYSYPYDPETAGLDFYESLEGMRVTVPFPVAVSPTRNFGSAGEVFVLPDSGRHIFPTTARTQRGGIYLQPHPDNVGDQNPEIVQLQFDADLFPGKLPAIAVRDRLNSHDGVVSYDYGSFEVKVTGPVHVSGGGLQPERTALVGTDSQLTVASYNVLNLSASDLDSAQRRLLGTQIAAPLRSPDVLALQEIQDNNGEIDDGTTDASLTLEALVRSIQSAGGPRYAFFDTPPEDGRPGGAPGGNIRVAFLYNPKRVRLLARESLSATVLGRAGIAESLAFRNSRDPLVGTFEFGRRSYTLINNHLTSRFGSTPIFGAIQPFVQAGEDERAAQSRALHNYVARILQKEPRARVAVLGDLNTFEFTDDLTTFLPGADPVLTSLLDRVEVGERYSYIFQGNSQQIDHVFVTPGLLSGAELDVVHLNVDFPALGSVEASDHEPLVARFK